MKDMTEETIQLAAAVVGRVHDLIQDGWVKGRFYDDSKNPTQFCILGALELASLELMSGALGKNDQARNEVIDLASGFILEAAEMGFQQSSNIPGWNDAGARTLEEVLGALRGAADRLWNLATQKEDEEVDMSQYVVVKQTEPQKQYLYNVLTAQA